MIEDRLRAHTGRMRLLDKTGGGLGVLGGGTPSFIYP